MPFRKTREYSLPRGCYTNMERRRFTGFGNYPTGKLVHHACLKRAEADALEALREEDLPALRLAIEDLRALDAHDRAANFELYLEILENPHG